MEDTASAPSAHDPRDVALMRAAIEAAATVRTATAPNPWVGAAVRLADDTVVTGATQPPGGPHAEIEALAAAGNRARGATLATTLEPCCSNGRTGPCTDALLRSGVARVLVGVHDPDRGVQGAGIRQLREAGIEVVEGVLADDVEQQLAPYLHHRRTGRPFVVLKLAASLDGATAAADGTSQWITGIAARTDAHRLRAESQAILVGAATVRSDDPTLTTRLVDGPNARRIVLGRAPEGAAVHPCTEWVGPLPELLDELGNDGVLQLMVEGGASVAASFHSEGLVDRYVVYLAPTLFGGDDARPLFVGQGVPTVGELRRGRFVALRQLGDDLRVDLVLDGP